MQSERLQPIHMPVRKLDRDASTNNLLTRDEITAGDRRLGMVYRFYDAEHGPLYIGLTGTSAIRWYQHRQTDWWPLAEYVAVSMYRTYEAASEAERAAIHSERPPFNKVGMRWRARAEIRLDGPASAIAEELHRIARPEYVAELATLLANPDLFPQPEPPPSPWPP